MPQAPRLLLHPQGLQSHGKPLKCWAQRGRTWVGRRRVGQLLQRHAAPATCEQCLMPIVLNAAAMLSVLRCCSKRVADGTATTRRRRRLQEVQCFVPCLLVVTAGKERYTCRTGTTTRLWGNRQARNGTKAPQRLQGACGRGNVHQSAGVRNHQGRPPAGRGCESGGGTPPGGSKAVAAACPRLTPFCTDLKQAQHCASARCCCLLRRPLRNSGGNRPPES